MVKLLRKHQYGKYYFNAVGGAIAPYGSATAHEMNPLLLCKNKTHKISPTSM